ncbi:MAG: ATP synthase subunit 6 [Flavobacteriales bacterium]|jgi:ATP synthase subunit 6
MIKTTNALRGIITATALTLGVFTNPVLAQEENNARDSATTEQHDEHGETEKAFNATEVILHHITDAHDWHILEYTNDAGEEVPVSVPLPVILLTNGNLDVFMSSGFHHGHDNVIKGDREYTLNHGHVEEINGASVIDLSITKNVASMILSAIIILLLFISVARAYSKRKGLAPKGLQSFMEPIILFVRDDIAIPNIGEKKAGRYMPYLLTVFFFVWINNLMGLIPIFPGGANLTGNISFTFVMAFLTFVITQFSGNKAHWKHVFATPGVPVWLSPIMIPVELIGLLAKPFALMIRLFANITAGHIIILSLISLIFIFKSVAVAPIAVGFVLFMNVLELLVAALQAYIFTLLSALFIGSAVAEHEHH